MEINIAGKIYKVVFKEDVADIHSKRRETCWGQVDFWDKEIRIWDGLSDCDKEETLWHEIQHVISEECSLSIDPDDKEQETMLKLLIDTLKRNNMIEIKWQM